MNVVPGKEKPGEQAVFDDEIVKSERDVGIVLESEEVGWSW